jgi:hypothetical protein
MTRSKRIDADLFGFIRDDPRHPRIAPKSTTFQMER